MFHHFTLQIGVDEFRVTGFKYVRFYYNTLFIFRNTKIQNVNHVRVLRVITILHSLLHIAMTNYYFLNFYAIIL